jgi:ABC-type transport system involved in cytochrome bd biosynthesis fused ATPase/permease subunit
VAAFPSAREDRLAAVLGAASALGSLALAALIAAALAQVVADPPRGLALLALALVGRAALGRVGAAGGDRLGRARRDAMRARLATDLLTPSRDAARADLASAVDQASRAPALRVLETAGRVGLIGLVAVALAGGLVAAGIVVALAALSVPLYRRAGARALALEADLAARRAQLEARQLELLVHSTELRALGAVDYGADEIAALSDSEHALGARALRAAMGSSLITEFLGGVSVGLVAMVEGFALLGGRVSLVRSLLAVLVTAEVVAGLRRAGLTFHQREQAREARERLERLTPAPPAPPEGADLMRAIALVTEHSPRPIDLTLRGGSRLLVRGVSGAGKTTLLETLVGWRAARSGTLERSRATIAFVSPSGGLLATSLRENLLVAGGEEADARRLLAALRLEGERTTDLDSSLADGRGLSEGERVRILLARALCARASLLVLDDVAGLLDAESRAAVARELARYPGAIVEAAAGVSLLDPATSQVVAL